MKVRNYKISGTPERLKELKEECEFIGRDCQIIGDTLVVFAIDRKHGKRRKAQEKRSKRNEKFARRNDKN